MTFGPSITLGLGARTRVGGVPLPPALKLAGTGLRLPTFGATRTGNNYVISDMAMGMPDIEVTEIAFFFPTFYCNTEIEVDSSAGYTIEGIATRVSGGLRTRGTIDGGLDPVVIEASNPATQYGKWIIFRPATPIPAGVTQIFSISYFMPDGEHPGSRANASSVGFISAVDGGTIPDERTQGFATSTVPMLSGSANLTNANGPRPPYPSMAMMRGASEIEYSALIIGDSIQYGSTQSTAARYYTSRMAFGQVEMALDNGVESRRIAANNMAIPGWSMGTQGSTTTAMRQLWAMEKARELNGGRPIADMIWCGHGQNSSTVTDLNVLLGNARTLASVWRSAIGDDEAPLYWVGMVASPLSTDIFQTTANQTPNGTQAIWPTGNRWLFNDAHESPSGALRVDGTVQGSVALWPVSSQDSTDNRDIFSVRPFTANLTSAYSGTGTMFMDAAPTVGMWIGFDASGTLYNGNLVQAVTGTGPFEVTIAIPGSPAIASGAKVQERWTDAGVHPSVVGHILYRDKIIEGKVALGFEAPPVPDVAPDITASSITGIPQDGQVLTANATVTGTPTPTLSYQWQRNGTNISGQTASTITLNAGTMSLADGNTVSCEITATNTAGTDTAEPTTTFTVPAEQILVQGATPGYFVDTANVPSGTNRIVFRARIWLPTGFTTNRRIFSQEGDGCDLVLRNLFGALHATIEDGTQTRMLSDVEVSTVGMRLAAETWYEIVFDVNHTAQTATLTVNGTSNTVAFAASSNGVFQTGREVSFLAATTGLNAVNTGTRFKDLSVDFNGTLRKAIPNNAALANADAWHMGGEFTAL